jgi:hypothetical protein
MKKESFDDLVSSVKEGGAILRGEARASMEFYYPDPKIDGCIREEKVKVCEFCGDRTREEELIVRYRHRGAIYVDRNSEAEICANASCGARYFRPQLRTMELDRKIKEGELKPE